MKSRLNCEEEIIMGKLRLQIATIFPIKIQATHFLPVLLGFYAVIFI
jgi:hypothetical protein